MDLKIIVQCDNILVTTGHTFQHCDLVAYLGHVRYHATGDDKVCSTHHELATFHKFLVNDLTSIVFSSFDMDGFLYDRVSPTTECLSSTVL